MQPIESTRGVLDPAWGNETTNTALCTASGDQAFPMNIPDGQGGSIIVWQDSRNGHVDIYAQRVDPDGSVEWSMNGLPVCTASQDQRAPELIPDGQGGAIIVWMDSRGVADYDIYVQRVSSEGVILWIPQGVLVCNAAADQSYPQLIPDGQGGAIIAWYDSRSGNNDIYAQWLSASGFAQWAANGVAVCTAVNGQENPQLVTDGLGGAFITWQDSRSGDSNIYMQRINTNGTSQWSMNGVAVCLALGTQMNPELVPDGQGGALIVWEDIRSGNFDVYVQRVSANGLMHWSTDGVPICSESNHQRIPKLVPDGQGGAIISWQDYRDGNYDIYAQRVNSGGYALWLQNGVGVSKEIDSQGYHQLVPDGQGGAIIVWSGSRYLFDDIYTQRVNENGMPLWSRGGIVVCSAPSNQGSVQITIDNRWLSGNQQAQSPEQANTANEFKGVIVVWQDQRNGNYDIFAQAINEDGKEFVERHALDPRWGNETTNTAVCAAGWFAEQSQLVPDGQGGAIIVWSDYRDGSYSVIYAQRVSASGAALWAGNGVAVCTAAIDQYEPQLVPDGQGGAIITWEDWRDGDGWDIYAQRLDASGIALWTANGVAVCTAAFDQYVPQLVPDGQGGVIIAWWDSRSGSYYDIYAQRMSTSGETMWIASGIPICTGFGEWQSQMVSDGQGGAIIVWRSNRGTIFPYTDIYAQRVSASGVLLWDGNGIPICTATGKQHKPQLVPDGDGGALIIWQDSRSATNEDIYAQRVSASGGVLWTVNGLAVCTDTEDQVDLQLVLDGQGGAIITWYDWGTDGIHAHRISLTQSTVVINEVMYAPASGDEWFELFNPTQIQYDISGWTLVNSAGTTVFTFPASTTLNSSVYTYQNITPTALNNDDSLTLRDEDGTARDFVCWGISEPFGVTYDQAVLAQMWTEGTGFFVNTFDHVAGNSIGRDMDSNDSNSKFDWEITCGRDASVPTPGSINVFTGTSYDIPLNLGWNLISVPLELSDNSVSNVLSSISGKWSIVKYYDIQDKADPWKTYRVGSSVNDLASIDNEMGFWIYITQANVTLTVSGIIPTSTSIPLYAGWNLVGYPTQTTQTVAIVLWGTGADRINVFDLVSPYIKEVGPTYVMKPGEGYWVHVPADTVWTVDW